VKRVVLLFGLLGSSVSAQTITHPPEGAPDPYSGWMSPVVGPCCGKYDCGVAQRCSIKGAAGFLERGECHPLPPDRYVEPPLSLAGDGELHVCRTPVWLNGVYVPVVRCWTDALGL
jgi:hypothetical protein